MNTETIKIDDRFGEEFKGEYVFQEISWAKRSRIIQRHTKYHEVTGKVVQSDYVSIQAETILASLKKQPENNPLSLERLLDEDKGIPIGLGERFSKVVNKLNTVSGKEAVFLSDSSEEKGEAPK